MGFRAPSPLFPHEGLVPADRGRNSANSRVGFGAPAVFTRCGMQTLTLLVISTGDVRDERQAVGEIVARVQLRHWWRVRIELLTPSAKQPPGGADAVALLVRGEAKPERVGADPSTTRVFRRSEGRGDAAEIHRTTAEFAEHFEAWLEERLRRQVRTEEAAPTLPEGGPFRGSAVLDHGDAPLFFGRDRAIALALERLARGHAAGCDFLLIHGAPGCGKSSMMRAGLAPRLMADGRLPEVGAWCGNTVELTAGDAAPLEVLAHAIDGALPELGKLRAAGGKSGPAPAKKRRKKSAPPAAVWDRARLARALADPAQRVFAVTAIVAALDRISAAKPAHFLLLVDPLDPVLSDSPESTAFLQVLAALARSGRIRVIATLDSALLPAASARPELADLLRHGGDLLLGPPDEAELAAILRYPARIAGLEYERDPDSGRGLDAQLAADAAGPDGLARLARGLEALHQQREGSLLTWAAYRSIGGLPAAAAPSPVRSRRRPIIAATAAAAVLLLGGLALLARDRMRRGNEATMAAWTAAAESRRALAAADFATGRARIDAGFPDEAPPHLLAALEGDPRHPEALGLLVETLGRPGWSFPALTLRHPAPPRAIAFGATPDTLFSAIDADAQGDGAVLRWDLATATLQASYLPPPEASVRGLSPAPKGKRLLVRFAAPVDPVLCDAKSLRVVARLPLPAREGIGAGCFAWSPDGLLLAYPARAEGPDPAAFQWRIVDAASGQTVRESDPLPASAATPLAARLDRAGLRAVARDGSLLDCPVDPTVPVRVLPGRSSLAAARFDATGGLLEVVRDGDGPPRPEILAIREDGGQASLAPAEDAAPFPAPPPLPKGSRLDLPVPLRAAADISALAIGSDRIALGSADGDLVLHVILPAAGVAANPAPPDAAVRAALRAWSECVTGSRLAEDSRAVGFLSAADRHARAGGIDAALLEPWLPAAAAVVGRIAALAPRAAAPDAWIPLWERLAAREEGGDLRLARRAAGLGPAHPWFRAYVRGRIAAADAAFLRGKGGDESIRELHRLAGDPDERGELKMAARAGDAARLDAAITATRAAHEATPDAATAIRHAEALVLRSRRDTAAEFLAGNIPPDAALDLEQAHFLIAAGLADAAPESLDLALDRHASPWLWSAWLDASPAGPLVGRVERTMTAVGGRGPAAAAALRVALAAADAPAIQAALTAAKDLPAPVREYAVARTRWAEGRKMEVFAQWPGDFPDYRELRARGRMGAWEAALPVAESDRFLATLRRELATLETPPDAGVDDLRALSTVLLDPATTSIFGIKRVREALVACALALAPDRGSAKLVDRMVDRARLGGAAPLDCLRIEARALMAAAEFTAAYARWLQLIDADQGEGRPGDYLDAARCLMEDLQDAAAVELLLRGKGRFPADPGYAYDAAWLLLSAGHPEEAGILLEHGFSLPFAADQREIALAMLLCAAEQTQRVERADEAFRELLALSPEWGDEEALKALGWPEALEQNLLAVAARNR